MSTAGLTPWARSQVFMCRVRSGNRASAAAPVRRSLLAEGRRALDRILGGEYRGDDLALLGPEGLVVPGALLVEDRLRGGGGQRRIGGDLGGQLEGDVEGLAGVSEAVDQPELGAAVGRDRLASQRELHGDRGG